MMPQGGHSKGEAIITVTISLSEKSDLLRVQSGDVDERVEHCRHLFGVARTEIYDVAIRRIVTQDRAARERCEKQSFKLVDQRNGDDCCRGADIADDGKNMILFDQLP